MLFFSLFSKYSGNIFSQSHLIFEFWVLTSKTMRAHPSPGLRTRLAADGDAFHLPSISYEQQTGAVSFRLHCLMKSPHNFNWVGILISFSRWPQMLSAFYRWENRVSLWVASSLSKRWLDNQLCHYKARREDSHVRHLSLHPCGPLVLGVERVRQGAVGFPDSSSLTLVPRSRQKPDRCPFLPRKQVLLEDSDLDEKVAWLLGQQLSVVEVHSPWREVPLRDARCAGVLNNRLQHPAQVDSDERSSPPQPPGAHPWWGRCARLSHRRQQRAQRHVQRPHLGAVGPRDRLAHRLVPPCPGLPGAVCTCPELQLLPKAGLPMRPPLSPLSGLLGTSGGRQPEHVKTSPSGCWLTIPLHRLRALVPVEVCLVSGDFLKPYFVLKCIHLGL